MENQNSFSAENPALMGTLADARVTAREQLTAAWQLHVDRVKEQLENGWQQQIEHIFEQRFSEIQSRLQADFDQSVEVKTLQAVKAQLPLARASPHADN